MNYTALITGITGQVGSYLAELLLDKGYEVHGLVRRSATHNTSNIDHIKDELYLHEGDMSDGGCLNRLVAEIYPQEVYNLAAQSHVHTSFTCPEYTADIVGGGCLRLLEAIRLSQDMDGASIKFFQASSSEMFGNELPPQNLNTPFHPRSPYGVAKCYAFWQTVNHREAYNMYAVNGVMFNMESPRRGENFVTRKITRAVGRIYHGLEDYLYLGNLDARRDWSYCPDSVEAMWKMMQQDNPGDYIVATGETHTVREFCEAAFNRAGLDCKKYVRVSQEFYRPSEVPFLCGDMGEASNVLNWKPKTSFKDLVNMMVDADMEIAKREAGN